MKLPTSFKVMFFADLALCFVSAVSKNDIALAASVIILVILICATSILEAINKNSTNQH